MAEVYYIEGSDYTGKTTLIGNLQSQIKSDGKRVLVLKEPNGRYRDDLLNGDVELSFFERRLLFLACHMQTRELIHKEMNNYDYIIVDRSAVVSDMIYMGIETELFSDELNGLKRELRRAYSSLLRLQENSQCASFEPHLILLHIDEEEFKTRVLNRGVKENDINDLRGMDFKMAIYKSYEKFIYEDSIINNMIKNFFKSVHVFDGDSLDSKSRAGLIYKTVMKEDK